MVEPTESSVMSCSGLGVRFPGGVEALQGVDLSIEAGRFTVLLGHSGAGKSTLLRCMVGLTTPTSGTVTVPGLGEISNRRVLLEHRRRTGSIFQLHHLIGRQSVLDNVLMGRLGHNGLWRSLIPSSRLEMDLAMDCLSRVGLVEKANVRADRLSGGERQRVGIARALVQDPVLMLADEPVASLDPTRSVEVLSLLRAISEERGLTSIVSLHQVELARRFADRIVGMAKGRLVFDGPPEALDDLALETIYPSDPSAAVPLAPLPTTPPDSGELPARNAS
jgi:phosphonate transport system ATP-binding protein